MVILLCLGLSGRAHRQATSKQTWEYKIVRNLTEKELNEFAAQGWELAEVVATEGAGHTYYLKRAK